MKRTLLLTAIAVIICSCTRQAGPRTAEDFNFGWGPYLWDSPEFASGGTGIGTEHIDIRI